MLCKLVVAPPISLFFSLIFSILSYITVIWISPGIMSSSGEKKTASQTDGKAAQGKKSEMGMMSYRVNLSMCTSPTLGRRFNITLTGFSLSLH